MKAKKSLELTIDLKKYGLETAYQAAYAMLDRAYFRFDTRSAGALHAELKPKRAVPAGGLEALKSEFLAELARCALRAGVYKRTKKVRDALIAQALIGAASDKSVYAADPLGISRPWEEKYGGAKKKKGKAV